MPAKAQRALLIALMAVACARAYRLPVQVYSTAHGLPRNTPLCLVPDPAGLLWICTSEGLARFDGSEFQTFDARHGLPSRIVVDLLIAKDGAMWMVTTAGVCRLKPGAVIGDPCRVLSAPDSPADYNAHSIVQAPDGTVWVVTVRALYRARADSQNLEPVQAAPAGEIFQTTGRGPGASVLVNSDHASYLWDGATMQKISRGAPANCGFGAINYGRESEVWITSSCGLFRLVGSVAAGDVRLEPASLAGPAPQYPACVLRRRDGVLWLCVGQELVRAEERPGGSLAVVERLGKAQGIPPAWMKMLVEDPQGNLWGIAEGVGIFRITQNGFRLYDESDGLGNARISSLFESLTGELCVTTSISANDGPQSHLRVKNRSGFELVGLTPGPAFHSWGWGWNQFGLQAHDGEWWFPNTQGLYRYAATAKPAGLSGRAPLRAYERDEGGSLGEVFRAFEDSHGDIWFTSVSHHQLMRWERASGRIHHWTSAEGWPKDAIATVFRESASGTLWIGTFTDLLRLRGGRVESVHAAGAEEFFFVGDLRFDRTGRLWAAASNAGLFRCDNPDAVAPVFRRYSMREGLSSSSLRSVVEDDAGFIYAGTVRGVDRIDPRAPVERGNVRHYTAADGLPDGEQNVALRDRRGHLWFGTLHGLAEFDPAMEAPRPLPRVYIRRVRVRGEEMRLPWAGASRLALRLSPEKNQIEIEFAAADLRAGSPFRYQYRLEGVDADWSEPSPRSAVNYANLPPGKRSFTARAIGADGEIGPTSVELALDLAAPVWRRWWFVTLAALAAASLVGLLYHYRVSQLLAIERLRMHLATDLHDDIGASLTQISLLSEVGQRDSSRNALEEIARISRDLAREMSDIVWAVSPRHDRFDALAHRMRRFAEDAFPDGHLIFDTESLPGDLSLPIECRRPLFLVFKEAVNNVARHSGATRLTVRLAVKDRTLQLRVEDNGSGFDPDLTVAGEGLNSIRRRMKNLGGEARWVSQDGGGRKFIAILPLGK
jgi:signal transduction histidine kinase/ligand-binding sensor domain-containing protein